MAHAGVGLLCCTGFNVSLGSIGLSPLLLPPTLRPCVKESKIANMAHPCAELHVPLFQTG